MVSGCWPGVSVISRSSCGGLSSLILRGAEQDLALLLVHRPAALLVLEHRQATLHRRSRVDRLEPALHVRIFIEDDVLAFPRPQPGEDGDVGDGVVTGEP